MQSDSQGQPSNQGNVEISLSVEDTNKLRKQLGLRPLRVNSSADGRSARKKVENKERQQSRTDSLRVKDRIEETRRKRIERSILARRSISASAFDAEQDEENETLSDDDPAAWVAKMRNRRSEPGLQKTAELRVKKTVVRKTSGTIEYSERDLSGLKVAHAEEDLAENEKTILTLKDTDVLMDDENEDHEDVLQSVDVLQRNEKKRRKSGGPSATYDPTDSKEFARKGLLHDEDCIADISVENTGLRIGMNKFPLKGEDGATASAIGGTSGGAASKNSSIEEQLSLSVALDEKRQFQEDYDLSERAERGFSRRKKSKHGKSKKRKRHIEAELRDALSHNGSSGPVASGKVPPRPLSRVSAIRSKVMEKIDDEDRKDDEDAIDDPHSILHASLRNAREKARNSDMDASVKRILKIIDQAEENAGKEGDNFDDASANIIFNEMEQYVRNIPAAEPIPADSEEEEDINVENKVADRKESLGVQENQVNATNPKGNEEMPNSTVVETVDEKVDSAQSRISDMGIAAALARFRAMGDLRSRPEQQGRARDERIDWKELDSKVPVPAGQRNIKLTYTDESGHELTPKEAFRLMCHKFHGKGPSKNKRELRLRRQLQKIRLQQMSNDDTPLGSSSALRDETRRTGLAHVVLSGPSVAPVRSALERSSLAKVDKSTE